MADDSECRPGEGDEPGRVHKALEDMKQAEADLERARELQARATEELRKAEEELKDAEHVCFVFFVFFVGKERFETEHETLTGAQIKAMVPNWQTGYGLELEGHGDEPDRLIGDAESVRFHAKHPLHFTPVPPATFGGCR